MLVVAARAGAIIRNAFPTQLTPSTSAVKGRRKRRRKVRMTWRTKPCDKGNARMKQEK